MVAFSEPHFAAYYGGHSTGNYSVVDKVLPDMLHLIDPHWYQYPPMNPLWHSICGVFIFVVGCISMVGNGCVIQIFTTEKTLRSPANLLIINLAISDFMMMFTMGPPMVISCYHETWVFGPDMCQLYAMLGSLWGCGSIWSMTMIAMERYNVIVKGMAGTPLTRGGAYARIIFIWCFALVWTLAPMFGWNRYVPEGNMTACGTDYFSKDWVNSSYILVYAMFVYFTPLLTIMYCYWFILAAVSNHEKAMREQAKKMNIASLRSGENADKSAEHKLAKVALVTISLWFMAWTPYLVINFSGIFGKNNLSPLSTIWGSIFAKTNSIYNPIVYGVSHPKYRAALIKRYPALGCVTEQAPSDAHSQGTVVTSEIPEKA